MQSNILRFARTAMISAYLLAGTLSAWQSAGSSPSVAEADRQRPRVTLKAELLPHHVAPGRPVLLKLTLVNTLFTILEFEETYAIYDYRVVVQDAEGHEAPFTELGKQLRTPGYRPPIYRAVNVELLPGQQREAALDLTKLYDLTQPGQYTVRASRVIERRSLRDGRLPSARADSDELTLTIEMPPAN